MLLEDGWLVDARRVPSPHHDGRPEDEKPTLLVVHNISLPPGEFGGPWIDALFTGTIDPDAHPFFAEIAHLRVSAHCLIRRDGEVVQYVPFDKRAWHAGVSMYQGRERCNDFSIGIELEGTDSQIALLRQLPDDGLILLDDTLTHWHTNARLLQTMIGWWLDAPPADGKLALPSTFSESLYDVLMNARNQAWRETLYALPAGRYVVAVGALHLYGEGNLPSLLK